MSGKLVRFVSIVCFALVCAAGACAQGSLRIVANSLPAGLAGSSYQARIPVTGGAQPYSWQLADGKLPAGLKLNTVRGTISGVPTAAGEFRFSLVVMDAGIPAQRVARTFSITITTALTIEWKTGPAVHGQMLEGSVVVTNLAQQDVVLTVIVMGVNEIGRATALGYQEFSLKAGGEQVIPFGSSPGPGSYVVHADAVAEVARTNTIYRARKQTPGKLVIEEPE